MNYIQARETNVGRAAQRLADKKPALRLIIAEAPSGARSASLDAQFQFVFLTLIALAIARDDIEAALELDVCRQQLEGLEDTLRAAQCPLHRIGSLRQTHVTAATQLWMNVGFEPARADLKCEALEMLVALLGKSETVRVPCALKPR